MRRGRPASAGTTSRRTTGSAWPNAASAPGLADRPRGDYVLSTKVGRLLEPSPETAHRRDEHFHVPADVRRVWDASEAGVRRSLAESCERIGVDHVDIAYLHDPEEYVPPGGSLDEVLAEGWARSPGCGRREWSERSASGPSPRTRCWRRSETGMPDVVMLAGRYTLLDQSAGRGSCPPA